MPPFLVDKDSYGKIRSMISESGNCLPTLRCLSKDLWFTFLSPDVHNPEEIGAENGVEKNNQQVGFSIFKRWKYFCVVSLLKI